METQGAFRLIAVPTPSLGSSLFEENPTIGPEIRAIVGFPFQRWEQGELDGGGRSLKRTGLDCKFPGYREKTRKFLNLGWNSRCSREIDVRLPWVMGNSLLRGTGNWFSENRELGWINRQSSVLNRVALNLQ
jgi:hypothetical protein